VSLVEHFGSPDYTTVEYGIGFPSASHYGVNGALQVTRENIERALKIAFINFGVDPLKVVVEHASGDMGPTLQYLDWAVTLREAP